MNDSLGVISVNIWQIIISLCNLLIMFLILKKFLFKPVQDILAQRKGQVDKLYSDAEQSRTEAEASKKEYEERLSGARAEADAIVSGAKESAQRRSDAMIAEAESDATRIRQKAEEEIDREKREMLREVRGEISELAVSIASKVVGKEIDEKACDGFVDEFIQNVGDKQ